MKPTYVSLFSGVGGFDMGMDNAGFTCVAQVEWDKHCQTILHRHWPHTPKWGDISTVSGHDLPPADGIIFGSPCQDLSVAGKRAGLDGGRSGLFHEAVRIMKEMQDGSNGTFPRFAIWENVPGALSSNRGQDFGIVLDEMAQLGALAIEWAVLDARWFGVPQRRRRIFLVAIFDPAIAARCPNPLLPVSPRRNWNPPTSKSAGKTVTGNIETSPRGYVKAKRAMSSTDHDRWEENETAPTLNAFDNNSETRSTVLMPVAYSIREDAQANNFSATETEISTALNAVRSSVQSHHAQLFITEPVIFENSYRDGPRVNNDICHTLPAKMGTGGGNTPMLAEPVPLAFDSQFGSYANVHEDISPPVKVGSGVDIASPPAVMTVQYATRRLTPLECERLQGWPDDHTRWKADGTEQADTQRYKQCGNGVATPVAQWVAKQLLPLLTNE